MQFGKLSDVQWAFIKPLRPQGFQIFHLVRKIVFPERLIQTKSQSPAGLVKTQNRPSMFHHHSMSCGRRRRPSCRQGHISWRQVQNILDGIATRAGLQEVKRKDKEGIES
jgi:hypothetical protein